MDRDLFLIIDTGTGSVRVCVTGSDLRILSISSRPMVILNGPSATPEGGSWFDPVKLEKDILELTAEVLEKIPDKENIRAVTATSIREGVVLMDKSGQAFLGLPNIDRRGSGIIADIPDRHSIYKRTGHWVSPTFSATKLAGLREYSPELYGRISCFTSISDWIAGIFTGQIQYEHSQACETLLYDSSEGNWSPELCGTFGIDTGLLPRLAKAGTPAGKLLSHIIGKTGLSPETVFITGGADTQTAVKGTGAAKGDLVIVSGTTTPTVRITDSFFTDEKERCWTDIHIDSDLYLIESNTGASGINYQKFKENFFPDRSYGELEECYRSMKESICTARFGSVDFSGARTLSNGGFYMKTPLAGGFGPLDMGLALMKDTAFSIVRNLENQNALMPLEKNYVLACGGGMRSSLLCEMISSLAGLSVILKNGFEESSIAGCTLLAAEALGLKTAVPQVIKEYAPAENQELKKQYDSWQQLF